MVVVKNILYLNPIEYNASDSIVKVVKQGNFLHSRHQHFCLMIDDIVINKYDQMTIHHGAIHQIEYQTFFVLAKLTIKIKFLS
jgi:hypothetical protein